jgi:hypothetical protein
MFRRYLASDVNLQRIFFVFGTFFSIATAAAALARILPVYLGGLIFVIFGRGFWRCNTFYSFLLFNYLKEAKKER